MQHVVVDRTIIANLPGWTHSQKENAIKRGFLYVLSLALFLLLTKMQPLGCVTILLLGLADLSPAAHVNAAGF